MNVGSLFSGIGGFELGLERAGMRVVWQSEIDPYASAVLRKHWPAVPNHGDVKDIDGRRVERVDVLAGGPPCQRTSVASAVQGKRTGETMWPDMRMLVESLQPGWVLIEQPPGNAGWEQTVAHDLASIGYHTARLELSSAGCGAAHLRRRVFIVANPMRQRCNEVARAVRSSSPGAFARTTPPRGTWRVPGAGNRGVDGRLPGWVDRLRCLGNAVDPRCAEIIGRAVMEAA